MLKLWQLYNSIDVNQKVYKKELPIKTWKFPGQEVGVQIDIPKGGNGNFVVEALMPTSDEIMQLLQISNILQNSEGFKGAALNIPYFPYARQDRVCNKGEDFALLTFIHVLDNANFDEVNVVDLHSGIARDLLTSFIDNWSEITQADILNSEQSRQVMAFLQYDSIIFPDAGAKAKARTQEFKFGTLDVYTANKRRTQHGIEYEDMTYYGNYGLVVDDICDGGRTFIALAEMIRKDKPISTLDLYVTHGIFSHPEQFETLTKMYRTIYTYKYYGNNENIRKKIVELSY